MKSIWIKIYYLLWVPVKSLGALIGISVSILALISLLVVSFSMNLFLENDIFSTYPGDVYSIENWSPVDNTRIYDGSGKVISEQFTEYHVFLPYKKIPKKMIDSILAIEDRKFWLHQGMDIFAIARAALSYINRSDNKIKQGASTITQQVIKNLVLTNEKTVTRKLREIALSLYLETFVSKEKILEIYCNSMFLGNGAYGVGAAAKRYFGKDISELDFHETALIAGLFQSPGKYNPARYPDVAKTRQLQVLKAMANNKVIKPYEYTELKLRKINYKEYKSSYGTNAPYFVDYVMEEAQKILEEREIPLKGSGLKIYTTLNSKLDEHAQNTFDDSGDIFNKLRKNIIYDNKKQKKGVESAQGALVAIDRKSGEILTMIGGKNYEQSQYNRAVHALRAPGSVFKTFIYSVGLNQGMNWNKQYYVAPITIGNYRPRTQYSQIFSETTMLESFYKSINSTAVLLGQEIGINKVLNFVKEIGVNTPLKKEAATFLGGSEVTLLDMGRAYLTIANSGFRTELSAIRKIEDREGNVLYERPIVDPKTRKRILKRRSYGLIAEGLKSVVRYGTGYKVRHLSGKVAGKTGTSNKSKDNWFCGFTKDIVVIAWMGNDDQNSFRGNISASNTAAPLWARFVKKSLKELKSGWLGQASGITSAKVHPKFGHRDPSGIRMYFLPGQTPREDESDLLLLEQGKQLRVGMNDF